MSESKEMNLLVNIPDSEKLQELSFMTYHIIKMSFMLK